MKKIISSILFSSIFMLFYFNGNAQTDANIPYHGITLYIDYPDVPASVALQQLDSLINGINYQENGVQRTFRKYWHQQTRRNIDMKHDIFFYTAPLPSTYYDTVAWQNGILLWKDALEWVITNYPSYNWNSLDLAENGGLRSVMILSSSFAPAGVGAAHFANWTLSNGVKVKNIYGSVLKAPWDISNNMFMTLHESGHAIFGFPDTYDTDYDSGGTSFYSVMSGGKVDVEPVGGMFQAQKNWGHVVALSPGTQTITLRADGDSVVVFKNLHDTMEYFTIEARKQGNIGNSLFPANIGLLIWHSDTKVNTSNTLQDMTPMKHYRHSVEQADGLFQLEGNQVGGNIGDIFLPGKSFAANTLPSSNWWDDSASNLTINNIQILGADKISFTATVPSPHTDHYPIISQAGWSLVSATTPQAGYEGTKAFDGDLDTYYHIPWGNALPRPHEIKIDLGKPYVVNEFFYTANKNNLPPWEGRIEDYKLYISSDTSNWGNEVASGKFFQTDIQQYVPFANKTGRYLKFSALSSFNNDVRTSIAEMNLRGFDAAALNTSNQMANNDISIFPNPTSNVLHICTNSSEPTEFILFDLSARKILHQSFSHTTKINTEQLAQGIYIYELKNKNNVLKKGKIIKK